MKKLLFLFSTLLFISCSNNRPNDLTLWGYNGKIKSITEVTSDENKIYGKTEHFYSEDGILMMENIYNYNLSTENGNNLTSTTFLLENGKKDSLVVSENGKVINKGKFIYDDEGILMGYNLFDPFGNLDRKMENYWNEDKSRVIKRVIFSYSGRRLKITREYTYTNNREFFETLLKYEDLENRHVPLEQNIIWRDSIVEKCLEFDKYKNCTSSIEYLGFGEAEGMKKIDYEYY